MINIKNNFLEEKYFEEIQKIIISADTPWYFNQGVNSLNDGHIMMTHNVYTKNIPDSFLYNKLIPLFEKIKVNSLMRVKMNLYHRTEKINEHGFHVDFNNVPNLKTAVFYINTNNGYTKFENGKVIKSLENTLVTFPSYLKHMGSTNNCSSPTRIVININYF